MAKNGSIDLSLVIPVHNEEGNLETLYLEIKENLKPIKKHEIIFVDDGSRDKTFEILSRLSKNDKSVKVVRLKANYGQSIALRAGLDASKGEKIITIDGDGQHDPKYILDYYKKLDEYDVVCNYRKNHKKATTPIGNFLIKTLFNVPFKDSIGGMKGLTRQVKDNIYLYGNMHRYLPLLALWKGFNVGEQEIVLRERISGRSHYKPMKAFRGFIDLLTVKFFVSYSNRPSYIFGSAGLISSGIGGISLLYLILRRLFFGIGIMESLPLFLLSILLILLGFNSICFGFMADMISYNHLSATNESNYLIHQTINIY
jgi:glycosyltransferase involved in cell wall biosynthesis